jgi:hypothetical protein
MDYSSLIEGLALNNITPEISDFNNTDTSNLEEKYSVFDVNNFIQELKVNSQVSNKRFHDSSERFNSYDIAHTCIRSVLFRIFHYPLYDYSDSWLPVKLRTNLGTACHDFLQQSKMFTETEVYLRVPSKNISVKIDCLINNNVLVEIKSCNYADYDQIIKKNLPRTKDIYQAVLYKHLLENDLEESSKQDFTEEEIRKYNFPKHESYKIKTIQFIYICHELVCADTESIEQDIEFSKRLKKFLKSKNNKFWFIKTIELNLENFNIVNIENHVTDKLKELQKYHSVKQIPDMNNKYVDLKSCFFCLFKETCSRY